MKASLDTKFWLVLGSLTLVFTVITWLYSR